MFVHKIAGGTLDEANNVFASGLEDSFDSLFRIERTVGGDDDVSHVLKNMVGKQRFQIMFLVKKRADQFHLFPDGGLIRQYIKTGSRHLPIRQRVQQSLGINNGAPSRPQRPLLPPLPLPAVAAP